MKRKLMQFVASVLASTLLFAACGNAGTGSGEAKPDGSQAGQSGENQKTKKITILTSQGSYYADTYPKMAEKMKELYGYEVEWQMLPDDQYYVIVKSKVATGEVPDIIEYNTPSNNVELNAHEKVVPLDDQPWVSRLANPELLKDPTDGKIYAMPRDAATFFGGVYYNKNVLDKLGVSTEQPKSIAELKARMHEIKEKSNGEVTPLFMSNGPSVAWTTQIYMTLGYTVRNYPNDKEIIQKLLKNELKFPDAPGFVETLQEYKSFIEEGLVNEDQLSADYDACQEAVGTGKAAMAFQGEWFEQSLKAKYPDTVMGSWVIPYGGNEILGTGAYVRGLFVMKDGKQVDTAIDFLQKWSSPEIQNIYFSVRPGFPPFKDVDGGAVLPGAKNLVDNYINQNKYTYQLNDPMGAASAIWSELWKLYIDMLASDRDPKEVLESWQVVYEDYMKQQNHPGF